MGHRTSNIGHQTSDMGHRSSDIGHRTSNIGHRTTHIGQLTFTQRTSDIRPQITVLNVLLQRKKTNSWTNTLKSEFRSLKSEVWRSLSLKNEVGSLKFEVSGLKSEVTLKYEVWYLHVLSQKCEVWSVKAAEVWILKSKVWNLNYEVWNPKSDIPKTYKVWCLKS